MLPRHQVDMARGLAVLLGVAGVSHFAAPGVYNAIVPGWLPGSRRSWTLLSGAAELACAGLVVRRRTRRLGATLVAALFVVVFPANVQMAIDWRNASAVRRLIAFARLPLQVPLVWWAVRVRQGSPAAPSNESQLGR